MRSLGLRILRIALVALAAVVLFELLDPHGLGWLIIPIAIAASIVWTGLRWLRIRQGGREERWADAMLDPDARQTTIVEVRAAIDATSTADARARSRRVQLLVLLAGLLDADGRSEEALAALDELDPAALPTMDAALVRHQRAVVRLRAGDHEGAREALSEGPPRTGALELDLRIELVGASVALELGEAEEALETATRVRRKAAGDEAVVVEARVVRAAALDALEQRDEALKIVRSLGPELIQMLSVLGQPRVRGLAEEVRNAK